MSVDLAKIEKYTPTEPNEAYRSEFNAIFTRDLRGLRAQRIMLITFCALTALAGIAALAFGLPQISALGDAGIMLVTMGSVLLPMSAGLGIVIYGTTKELKEKDISNEKALCDQAYAKERRQLNDQLKDEEAAAATAEKRPAAIQAFKSSI
ncbi:MAG: hypothetical protein K1000chlam4_00657 [Chlamydiae bacterium]|nr:hypothetical protein [Chlamydiota bacterium]